jgi:LysR family glycine cleavage system transcriptional activator
MARDRFPPANWLRTFELVARYMSFSEAAQHLHISTSAVSQQIRNLEEYFGCKLFRRTGNRLALTEAAESCIQTMHRAFLQLQKAVDQLHNPEERETVNVSVAPSFATKWLLGRLGGFCELHPDLDVAVYSTANLESFNSNDIDVAIRYGAGHYPGLETRKLIGEKIVPVAAPRLVEAGRLALPADLARVRLLHDVSPETDRTCPDWEMVANLFGLSDLKHAAGPRFNSSAAVVDAAVAGLGVGLAKYSLARNALARGELVHLFERTFEVKHNYYVVFLPERRESRKIQAFVRWIEAEAAGGGAGRG